MSIYSIPERVRNTSNRIRYVLPSPDGQEKNRTRMVVLDIKTLKNCISSRNRLHWCGSCSAPDVHVLGTPEHSLMSPADSFLSERNLRQGEGREGQEEGKGKNEKGNEEVRSRKRWRRYDDALERRRRQQRATE